MILAATQETDVIVIGGGPAGSTASTLIAQHGHRVQLFERDQFPRFHIGESLIPETYWVLKRLNMLPKMKGSHFIKKHSVQFVSQTGKLSEPFYFLDHKPHECSQTWQVLRSEFDTLMLENAAEHGVEVHQRVRVLDVLMNGDKAYGVRIKDENGNEREIHSKVVVDCSGQSSMIASRLKLKVPDNELRKGALWTYYEGAYRDTARDEGATIVLQTQGKKGWFWYIPLHNNIVSVGITASFDYLFDRSRGDHEAIYNQELDRCPAVRDRVAIGKRISGFYATKDYSYRANRVAGDGWVLAGDAFGFLDPLYSSGVLLALKSGQMAADAVVEGLAKGDVSAKQLGYWQQDFTKGMDRMRRMVCEFYDGFSFGKFVRRYPHLKGHLTDILIGDLFKDSLDELWGPLDSMKEPAVEAMPE